MSNSNRIMGGESAAADKFVVRLPDGMRARIGAQARPQHRSMNSYVVRAVEAALLRDEAGGEASLQHVEVTQGAVETVIPWAPWMPCRFEGKVWIIQAFRIHPHGEYVLATIRDQTGYCKEVQLEELSPY